MACKIAHRPDDVKPHSWPEAGLAQADGAGFTAPPPARQLASGMAGELTERLAGLERTRESEIANARKEGLQEGLRQAQSEAATEVQAATDRLAKVIADLASLKRRVRNEAETDLVKLSLAIARRILHRELATDAEAITGLVHAALHKLQNREILQVRVFPSGANALQSALERMGMAPATRVISDPSLKCGDLIFETSFGELDASVETQLQEIQRGFADRLSLR